MGYTCRHVKFIEKVILLESFQGVSLCIFCAVLSCFVVAITFTNKYCGNLEGHLFHPAELVEWSVLSGLTC